MSWMRRPGGESACRNNNQGVVSTRDPAFIWCARPLKACTLISVGGAFGSVGHRREGEHRVGDLGEGQAMRYRQQDRLQEFPGAMTQNGGSENATPSVGRIFTKPSVWASVVALSRSSNE